MVGSIDLIIENVARDNTVQGHDDSCLHAWPFVVTLHSYPPLSFFVGKTTLADSLVASNGIISSRLAGKVSMTWSQSSVVVLSLSYYCSQTLLFGPFTNLVVCPWSTHWSVIWSCIHLCSDVVSVLAEVPGQPGGWADPRDHDEVQRYLTALCFW